MKSKRSSRDLPFIKIKSDNVKQGQALISGVLICQKTGIIFKIQEFRTTRSIQSVSSARGLGTRHQIGQKNPRNVLCVVKLILTKTVQTKKKETQNVPTVGDLMSPTTEAVLSYKDQAFRQHVVQNQVSHASILKRASLPPPSNTFKFIADQIYPWLQTC